MFASDLVPLTPILLTLSVVILSSACDARYIVYVLFIDMQVIKYSFKMEYMEIIHNNWDDMKRK